jgi:hypothetical protein
VHTIAARTRANNELSLDCREGGVDRTLTAIEKHVAVFLDYARANPGTQFLVTRIGCGLAGYSDAQIAALFKEAPANCGLPQSWRHSFQ